MNKVIFPPNELTLCYVWLKTLIPCKCFHAIRTGEHGFLFMLSFYMFKKVFFPCCFVITLRTLESFSPMDWIYVVLKVVFSWGIVLTFLALKQFLHIQQLFKDNCLIVSEWWFRMMSYEKPPMLKWKLTILTLADLATILAISLRRTRLVTPLPSPPGRTRAGASHGVTRGAVMTRTRVARSTIIIYCFSKNILASSYPQAGPHRPGGQDTEHVLPPYPWSHWHVSGATHVPCSQRGLEIYLTE